MRTRPRGVIALLICLGSVEAVAAGEAPQAPSSAATSAPTSHPTRLQPFLERLANMRRDEAVSTLRHALRTAPSPRVRAEAAKILGALGATPALPDLQSAARSDHHAQVRLNARNAALRITDPGRYAVEIRRREAEAQRRQTLRHEQRRRRLAASRQKPAVPFTRWSVGLTTGYGGAFAAREMLFGETYGGAGWRLRLHGSFARRPQSRHAVQVVLYYDRLSGEYDKGGLNIMGGGTPPLELSADHVGALLGWLWRPSRYFNLSLGVGPTALFTENGVRFYAPDFNLALTGLLPLGEHVALQLCGEFSFAFLYGGAGISAGVLFGF